MPIIYKKDIKKYLCNTCKSYYSDEIKRIKNLIENDTISFIENYDNKSLVNSFKIFETDEYNTKNGAKENIKLISAQLDGNSIINLSISKKSEIKSGKIKYKYRASGEVIKIKKNISTAGDGATKKYEQEINTNETFKVSITINTEISVLADTNVWLDYEYILKYLPKLFSIIVPLAIFEEIVYQKKTVMVNYKGKLKMYLRY